MSIYIEQISKSFGDVQALNNVSIEAGEGELFGLIGPDGAGKTTLFRILVTLLRADSGRALVRGMDVQKAYRKIREIIGYMPGRFSLYHDLSVRENLEFYATVFGTTISAHYDLIEPIYAHIAPFESRLAGRLSGGMKQKLALSCALIHRPDVLILDEPTTGVDAVSRTEFWDMLKGIRDQGITIMVSTPYMDEAAMCDRVGLIQGGSLLTVTEPGKLRLPGSLRVFSFRSSGEIYDYLDRIRARQECHSAYLFGDEIHVMAEDGVSAEALMKEIGSWNVPGIEINAIEPGIEDIFMEMMRAEGI